MNSRLITPEEKEEIIRLMSGFQNHDTPEKENFIMTFDELKEIIKTAKGIKSLSPEDLYCVAVGRENNLFDFPTYAQFKTYNLQCRKFEKEILKFADSESWSARVKVLYTYYHP